MIVEVAYALAEKQSLISLEIKEGSTLKEAIDASGILKQYKQIDLSKDRVGIFSKFATLDTVLREKDRVEIYRPLEACLLYTSPSPRDRTRSRMPSSA